MAPLFESLESRQLFSASLSVVTQDATALQANSQTMHADLANWKQKSDEATKTLFADLHKQKGTTPPNKAVRIFSADEIAQFRKVSKDVHALLSVTVKSTDTIVADIKQILKKSTPALTAKLASDIAKLKTETTKLTATANADAQAAQTLLQKDLTPILAVTSLNADANKAKTAMTNGLQAVMTDLTTFSTTVAKFTTDAAA